MYYWKFIYKFLDIVRLLYKFIEKNKRFEWNEDCNSVFDKLRRVLISIFILLYFNEDGLFILDIDVLNMGLGVVFF